MQAGVLVAPERLRARGVRRSAQDPTAFGGSPTKTCPGRQDEGPGAR